MSSLDGVHLTLTAARGGSRVRRLDKAASPKQSLVMLTDSAWRKLVELLLVAWRADSSVLRENVTSMRRDGRGGNRDYAIRRQQSVAIVMAWVARMVNADDAPHRSVRFLEGLGFRADSADETSMRIQGLGSDLEMPPWLSLAQHIEHFDKSRPGFWDVDYPLRRLGGSGGKASRTPAVSFSLAKDLVLPVVSGVLSAAVYDLARQHYSSAPFRSSPLPLNEAQVRELARYVLNLRFDLGLESGDDPVGEEFGVDAWKVWYVDVDKQRLYFATSAEYSSRGPVDTGWKSLALG